jgi:hypothetical protein
VNRQRRPRRLGWRRDVVRLDAVTDIDDSHVFEPARCAPRLPRLPQYNLP